MMQVRSVERQSSRGRLFILVACEDTQEPLWAWDIGLGGLQCRAKYPRFVGTFLDMSFRLPGQRDVLSVGGQVTHMGIADGGSVIHGIRFCRLSAKAHRAIYRFLDERRSLWDAGPAYGHGRQGTPGASVRSLPNAAMISAAIS